jgi:hypothetical protein
MAVTTTPPRPDARPGTPISEVSRWSPDGGVPNPSLSTCCSADYFTRRFKIALFDLGLDGFVPGHWITSADDGIDFTVLTIRQAGQPVQRLEDLAAANEVPQSFTGGWEAVIVRRCNPMNPSFQTGRFRYFLGGDRYVLGDDCVAVYLFKRSQPDHP